VTLPTRIERAPAGSTGRRSAGGRMRSASTTATATRSSCSWLHCEVHHHRGIRTVLIPDGAVMHGAAKRDAIGKLNKLLGGAG
jgi:hypothetical protein